MMVVQLGSEKYPLFAIMERLSPSDTMRYAIGHKSSRSDRVLITLLLTIVFLVTYSADVSAQEGCTTSNCHQKLEKAKNVHPVLQPCDTCHKAVLTPHPQKGKETFKLVQDMPNLCATCHNAIGTKKIVHSPVKNGMCTSCHNPHSSNEPKLLTISPQKICTQCHTDKQNYGYVHGPAATGDCTTCHHPHESAYKALVLQEGAELCTVCHLDIQEQMKRKNVHPALFGGCASCHNPHGSSFPKFLPAQGDKMCFQCHPKVGEKIEKSKVIHKPIKTEKACASCHAPHTSEGEKLLLTEGMDLCLTCHKDILKKEYKVLHGPIKDGKCAPCHDPHGSQYDRLLLDTYSSELYISYSDNEYKLCFKCHNRDLLRYPDTSFATGFRDGDRNLHYLHVNRKEKGRNCKLCHNLHGGELPKLLADKVPFGKWNLPLKFIKTETGGSCTPGCHKTFSYDRKTPGKAPEAAPAKEKAKEKGKR